MIRSDVLHGLGGVIDVVGTTVMVVVPFVLPVQLEMRKVRDGASNAQVRASAIECHSMANSKITVIPARLRPRI